MNNDKIKLFQTAKQICERGDISLSAGDKKRIEDETRELLRRSMSSKSASSGNFMKVLEDLRNSKSAGTSFKIVARYLLAEDAVEGDVSRILDQIDEAVEKIEESVEQVEDALGGKVEDKKDDIGDIKEDKEDDKAKVKPKGENPFMDKEDAPKDVLKDDDAPDFIDKAKEAVVRLAQEFDLMNDDKPEAPPFDKGKEKERGKDRGRDKDKKPMKLKDLGDKKKDEEIVTEDEMGMEKGPASGSGLMAKVKVSITPDRNIAASYDNKPLFLAVPNDSVKSDSEKLRRAANKVLGLVIYDGPKVAAAKCGSKLMAGVDEDILTDSDAEVDPNRNDVTDDGETDTQEAPSGDPSTALEDSDTDTADKPDKVTAIRKRLDKKRKARRKAEDTILDDAETLTEEKSEANPNALDSGADDDTDTQESRPAEPSDMLSGGETDIKQVEANYKQLYSHKAKKMASEHTKKFVERFARCMKIASTRMALNHDDNPLKAAALDVLTSDEVYFSDGESFVPMDSVTAKEIVELIAAESHDNFVDYLMGRTSDLMEKSDDYLTDIEGDISNLSPVDVEVPPSVEAASSRKSSRLRKAAKEGNFDINTNIASGNSKPANPIRDAIGTTKIGLRSAQLRSIAGR